MGMSPPCSLVPNRHQNPEPACPGACHGPPEAPQLEPLTPGPSPCPHSPLHRSPTPCRAPCVHTIPRPPRPDQHAPDQAATTTARATLPLTLWRHARASPTLAVADPAPPARSRVRRAVAGPPHHPLASVPLHGYKSRPRPRASTTPPPHHPPLHPGAAEEELGAPHQAVGHRTVTPRWCVSGDATAALLLPRPPSLAPKPPRSPSPPAGASPAALSLPVLCLSGWRRWPWVVDREINGPG